MRYTAGGRLGLHFLFSLQNHSLGYWGEGRPLLGPRGTPPESSRLPFCRVHGRRSVNTCGLTNRLTNSAGPFCFRSPRPRDPQAHHCPGPTHLSAKPPPSWGSRSPLAPWPNSAPRIGNCSASPAQEFPLPEPRPGEGLGWAGPGAEPPAYLGPQSRPGEALSRPLAGHRSISCPALQASQNIWAAKPGGGAPGV